MKIIDIYPDKAQYVNGDKVIIYVNIDDDDYIDCRLTLEIYHLGEKIQDITKPIEGRLDLKFEIDIVSQEESISGYGILAKLIKNGYTVDTLSTAFDIVDSWELAPRYGFLSDFSPNDLTDEEDIKQINRLHINVIQFYDWMYRHHQFISASEVFTDPLGRTLSMKTVKQKIDYCHKYGIKAVAYAAVYGAEKEFYDTHNDLGLYISDDKPIVFADFIYIMDISRKSKWHSHIIDEFLKAIEFGFDGIHMDQYGFPKEALSYTKEIRRLKEDFPVLINDSRNYFDMNGYNPAIIFNAVNNWPVESVANTSEDVVYIEVWPPNETYADLYELVRNAKKNTPDKQVILAAYMRPFSKDLNVPLKHAETSALLTMATIFVSGGFHLLLGERYGILTEGYYPNYAEINDGNFNRTLQNYYDFIVRYEELLFDNGINDITMAYTGGINKEYLFEGGEFSPKPAAEYVWTTVKEKSGYKIINLINYTGISDDKWNEPKDSGPSGIYNITITAHITEDVKDVFITSPDMDECKSNRLNFSIGEDQMGKYIRFIVPTLEIWDMVYIILK